MHKIMTIAALLGGVLLTPAPSRAEPGGELLERVKSIESRSHQARIAILREADACIQAARTREAYRACEEKEKEARQALREELKPQREALRAEVHARRAERETGNGRF
ncbi:MAG: hypothetical protein ACOZAQ_08560 [Pseudomonadota bacterium]